MTRRLLAALLALAAVASPPVRGGEAARRAILPPELPWQGRSLELLAPPADPWITPAERDGFELTPSYDETLAYLRRLAAQAPEIQLVSLGKSPEGRELWLAVVSKERARTPEELRRAGKPLLFAQAGIHSGEIDGKDAGLMLLRDLTVGGRQKALLERASLLFLPILNVDGHERASAFSRINQRGPENAGWRTTARNLNLNRDYAKLDAPEMRALVRALEAWQPDLYLDLHVTDGMDYQHDVTFGWNGRNAYSPRIVDWLDARLQPALQGELRSWGHLPGPLIQPLDNDDPASGLVDWTADPRFSTGYGHARHLATVLFENHSLKPYRQRVLGAYVSLVACLRTLGEQGAALRAATAADRAARPARLPLAWKAAEKAGAPLTIAGIAWRKSPSPVSGGTRVEWLGQPEVQTHATLSYDTPSVEVGRPRAWWVPPAWADVIERLALHGIAVERTSAPREVEAEMYRVTDFKLGAPFEGHVTVTPTLAVERRRELFPAGSARVTADQPLAELAALLLEPASPDSFFQWGFFLEVLSRTEYVEAYVMEPMGAAMLAEDPALKAEFEQRLKQDPAFAASPAERLQWLYRRTPFADERHGLYPVARELP